MYTMTQLWSEEEIAKLYTKLYIKIGGLHIPQVLLTVHASYGFLTVEATV
jgi:hypothetical protein